MSPSITRPGGLALTVDAPVNSERATSPAVTARAMDARRNRILRARLLGGGGLFVTVNSFLFP